MFNQRSLLDFYPESPTLIFFFASYPSFRIILVVILISPLRSDSRLALQDPPRIGKGSYRQLRSQVSGRERTRLFIARSLWIETLVGYS